MASSTEILLRELSINSNNLFKFSQYYIYDDEYDENISILLDLIEKLDKGKYNKIFNKDMREMLKDE